MFYKEVLHQLLLKKHAKQKRLVTPKPQSLKKHRVPESSVESNVVTITPNSPTALPVWFDDHRHRYLDDNYQAVTVTAGKWLKASYCAHILLFDEGQALAVGDTILYRPTDIVIGANGDVYQNVSPTVIYIHTQDMWYVVKLM